MSPIREFRTASRVIVWLLAVSVFGLGAAYAAEPATVAGTAAFSQGSPALPKCP